MKIIIIFKIVVGFAALLFGAVGLVLPVWPTTPFILLAIACFSSTPRIQAQILKIRVFKEYYDSYTKGKGLRKQTVAASLAFLWTMLMISGIWVQEALIIWVLAFVGVVVTIHILWIARGKKRNSSEVRD